MLLHLSIPPLAFLLFYPLVYALPAGSRLALGECKEELAKTMEDASATTALNIAK